MCDLLSRLPLVSRLTLCQREPLLRCPETTRAYKISSSSKREQNCKEALTLGDILDLQCTGFSIWRIKWWNKFKIVQSIRLCDGLTYIISYIFKFSPKANTPSSLFTWISSLNTRWVVRYFARRSKALWFAKSSNWENNRELDQSRKYWPNLQNSNFSICGAADLY